MSTKRSTLVSFRVSDQTLAGLIKKAAERGESHHLTAKYIVENSVSVLALEGYMEELAREVGELANAVQGLQKARTIDRRGIMRSFAQILFWLNEEQGQKFALEWVEQEFTEPDED